MNNNALQELKNENKVLREENALLKRNYQQQQVSPVENKPFTTIGHFEYDLENGTSKYIPHNTDESKVLSDEEIEKLQSENKKLLGLLKRVVTMDYREVHKDWKEETWEQFCKANNLKGYKAAKGIKND